MKEPKQAPAKGNIFEDNDFDSRLENYFNPFNQWPNFNAHIIKIRQ